MLALINIYFEIFLYSFGLVLKIAFFITSEVPNIALQTDISVSFDTYTNATAINHIRRSAPLT